MDDGKVEIFEHDSKKPQSKMMGLYERQLKTGLRPSGVTLRKFRRFVRPRM